MIAKRIGRLTAWTSWVSCSSDAFKRGTLACAPRSAAVLARALAVTGRAGDASHPPHPQRRTVFEVDAR